MTLIIFISITLSPLLLLTETFNVFFYISIAVCEAALGLSLVILYANKKGNDILKSF